MQDFMAYTTKYGAWLMHVWPPTLCGHNGYARYALKKWHKHP